MEVRGQGRKEVSRPRAGEDGARRGRLHDGRLKVIEQPHVMGMRCGRLGDMDDGAQDLPMPLRGRGVNLSSSEEKEIRLIDNRQERFRMIDDKGNHKPFSEEEQRELKGYMRGEAGVICVVGDDQDQSKIRDLLEKILETNAGLYLGKRIKRLEEQLGDARITIAIRLNRDSINSMGFDAEGNIVIELNDTVNTYRLVQDRDGDDMLLCGALDEVLFHELVHAAQNLKDKKQALKSKPNRMLDRKESDRVFSRISERKVITGVKEREEGISDVAEDVYRIQRDNRLIAINRNGELVEVRGRDVLAVSHLGINVPLEEKVNFSQFALFSLGYKILERAIEADEDDLNRLFWIDYLEGEDEAMCPLMAAVLGEQQMNVELLLSWPLINVNFCFRNVTLLGYFLMRQNLDLANQLALHANFKQDQNYGILKWQDFLRQRAFGLRSGEDEGFEREASECSVSSSEEDVSIASSDDTGSSSEDREAIVEMTQSIAVNLEEYFKRCYSTLENVIESLYGENRSTPERIVHLAGLMTGAIDELQRYFLRAATRQWGEMLTADDLSVFTEHLTEISEEALLAEYALFCSDRELERQKGIMSVRTRVIDLGSREVDVEKLIDTYVASSGEWDAEGAYINQKIDEFTIIDDIVLTYRLNKVYRNDLLTTSNFLKRKAKAGRDGFVALLCEEWDAVRCLKCLVEAVQVANAEE